MFHKNKKRQSFTKIQIFLSLFGKLIFSSKLNNTYIKTIPDYCFRQTKLFGGNNFRLLQNNYRRFCQKIKWKF